MNFEKLLRQAQNGDKEAQEEIFRMYRPLLIKNSMDINIFDEDLYQEFSATLLKCIQKFQI
jgi:DNA-directed RNA polymerase specialized sigma24 family protein